MAFCIEIADTARFTVKFSIRGGDGTDKPASFEFIADRVSVDDYKKALDEGGTFADFLVRVGKDWTGVRDGDGTPVDYSEDALRRICNIPGLASLMFKLYGIEVSVKEKN